MHVSDDAALPGAAPRADGAGSSPRQRAAARARAATRARLIEAGQALFAEQGLHGVTTHDVARAAGVAAGTFYLHFSDKHALFRELARRSVDGLLARLEAATDGLPERGERVRAQTVALVDYAESHRELIGILFGREGAAAAVEADLLARLAAQVEESRRKEAPAGGGEPALHPGVLSHALVGLLARVVAWWAEDPSRATREQVIDTLTRIQLSGTLPD